MANFMDLPPEMRNGVYTFMLPNNKIYDLKKLSKIPSICMASRGVCEETLPMWRNNNTFRFVTGLHCQPQGEANVFRNLADLGLKDIQHLEWMNRWEAPKHILKRFGLAGHEQESREVRILVIVFEKTCSIHIIMDKFGFSTNFLLVHWARLGLSKAAKSRAREMICVLKDVLGRDLKLTMEQAIGREVHDVSNSCRLPRTLSLTLYRNSRATIPSSSGRCSRIQIPSRRCITRQPDHWMLHST